MIVINRFVHEGEKRYRCEYCGKTSSYSHHHRQHVNSVHLKKRDHKCNHCEKYFTHAGHLKSHIKLVHEKAQNFQCEKCDKTYALKLDLERHFTSNHILEKGLFKCEICDRHFNQDSTLYSHKQLVHDVSSKFNCAICGKVYHLTNYLKRHMKSHEMSNDKTVCDICGKVVTKNNLNLHKRVHAKKDTRCTLCEIDFKHLKTLKRHLDSDHKNISFKCDICDKKLLYLNMY